MAIWTLKTLQKKSAIERQHWDKDSVQIIREEGYRWGTFYCESDHQPNIDLNNKDGYEIGQDDYEWELEELDDGCWGEWEFPDNMSKEEQEKIQDAWNEDFYEGMGAVGWSFDDTKYILLGPLELSDENGNVVGSGDTE